ncbi:MAG: O-antigen ligase family protein, partial [Candidatus Paceibacteria bacterium]
VAWRYYRKHAFALMSLGTLVGIMLLTFSSVLNVYTATEMPNFEKIPVYDRITDLFEGKVSDSILWRMHMWRDMWNYGWQDPWIGDGTGHVKQAVEKVRGVELGSLEIHNDYIRVFVEWGLVGLAVFLLWIGSLFWALGIRVRNKPHYILIIALSLAVGIYIATGWDNLLRQTANMWLFFGLLAAIFKWDAL